MPNPTGKNQYSKGSGKTSAQKAVSSAKAQVTKLYNQAYSANHPKVIAARAKYHAAVDAAKKGK